MDKKKEVAELMVSLQQTLINGDIAMMFDLYARLENATSPAYADKVLFVFTDGLPDSFLVKNYIKPALESFERRRVEEEEMEQKLNQRGGEKE